MHANTGKRNPSIVLSLCRALPLSLLLAFSGELITAERRHEYANRTRKDARDYRGIFHDFHDFHDPFFSVRSLHHIRLNYMYFTLKQKVSDVSASQMVATVLGYVYIRKHWNKVRYLL